MSTDQPEQPQQPGRPSLETPEQQSLGPWRAPHTGDSAVDDALCRLQDTLDLSLAQRVPGFEHLHHVLQDRLADVDG